MLEQSEVYICTTCGGKTHFEIIPAIGPDLLKDRVKCTNCWEVEGRLKTYLRSKKGLEFVRKSISEANNQCEVVVEEDV